MPDPFPPSAPGLRLSGRFIAAILFLSCLFATGLALAQATDADTDTTLDLLRKQVDAVQQEVANPDKLNDAALQRLRATVATAQTQSSDIADRVAPQLASLEARAAQLGTAAPGVKEDPDLANQRALLAKNRGQLDAQVKLARLISVESGQLATRVETLRRSQFQAQLGERTDSILSASFWAELRDNWPLDGQRLRALGADLGTASRNVPVALWLAAVVVLGIVAGLPRLGRSRLLHWLSSRVPAGRLRRSLHAFAILLRWTLSFGAVAIALDLTLNGGRTLPPATTLFVSRVAGMLWFTGFVFGLTTALISAERPSWRLLPIPDPVAVRLRWFPLRLAAVTLLTWLAERLTALINASLALTVAVNCVVALALSLTLAIALMRAERLWRADLARDADAPRTRPLWLMLIALANWLVLAAAIVSLLVGYVAFGSFAIRQVVWAGILIGSAYLLAVLIDDALMAWLGDARRADDDAADEKAVEAQHLAAGASYAQVAVLLSGLLRLMVLLFALALLVAPFGEGPTDLLRRSDEWRSGISIGQVTLQPGAVMQALIVLLLGLGAVRALRGWLENRYLPTTSLDPGMRVSATSLFGYFGVVVAVALAMSALGIGLERIAWVASALSVGIGFGLQAVVQNFVSGLILLAERPVKVGDWVSLGGVEGDIRRINVRATEIQMGDRSTVIVPNSEFITKVVRNVTLADPIGLVQVKLPVPLGSDPDQVRQLLLDAFDANDDVLENPAPGVSLDGIEGSQLQFSATGFVKSPRLAGGVKSALLFDVLSRVKAAGIQLSAPPTMLLSGAAPGATATPAAPAAVPIPPLSAAPG